MLMKETARPLHWNAPYLGVARSIKLKTVSNFLEWRLNHFRNCSIIYWNCEMNHQKMHHIDCWTWHWQHVRSDHTTHSKRQSDKMVCWGLKLWVVMIDVMNPKLVSKLHLWPNCESVNGRENAKECKIKIANTKTGRLLLTC